MNKDIKLICPICGKRLIINENTLKCAQHHTYDIARQGYVNLLPVQNKHSLNPGDTKEALKARRSFLNKGIYLPICSAVTEKAKELLNPVQNPCIADIGCGEGYYLRAVADTVKDAHCIGLDISKDGVKMACSRGRDISWAVATAAHIPIESSCIDLITAMFSLFCDSEFSRILKPGGYVIEVTAATNHLIELKPIIYDRVFEQNKKPCSISDNFLEISCEKHSFDFTLENRELTELLKMTPHFWRIHKERREKLEKLPCLKLTAEYFLRVLQKVK